MFVAVPRSDRVGNARDIGIEGFQDGAFIEGDARQRIRAGERITDGARRTIGGSNQRAEQH